MKMNLQVLPIFILCLITLSNAILQNTVDVKRLQGIFQQNIKSKDITSLYYSIKGLKLLNVEIPNVCEEVKNSKYDLKNVEHMFYLTNAAALSNCLNTLTPEVLITPTQILDNKDLTIPEIYYALYAKKALGKGAVFEKENGLKLLVQMLKKDDSPANYGYVFALCEHLGCGLWTASHAEGVLLTADEIDSKAMHFEGGLPVTSLLLTTIIRTYQSLKKPTPMSEEQRYKFAEYLVSRGSVTTPRGAALLLEAAQALADDQPSPVSIAVKGKKYVSSDAEFIEISISDLIGRPVRGLKPEEVVAQSGTRLADDVVVLSKQVLRQKANEPTTFVLNLNKIRVQYGQYKIALTAGSKAATLNIAVLGDIQVNSVEIGVGDVDGTSSPKMTTMTYPNKLTEKLQADHLQKVSLKFVVRDKWSKPVVVQQAFVRVSEAGGAPLDTVFVAEPDHTNTYKVELNVGALAKHLKELSGLYTLTIYLGDNAVSNPIAWPLGEIMFNFGKDANAVGSPEVYVREGVRGPLPELRHRFRAPEARPARLVSDVCAAAAAAPLLLLLLLWATLGINLRHFPLSLSALLFHLSLGGALALYGVLWVKLSMFETMRYLLPLAAITFLSGHRLLRRLVQNKTQTK